MKPQLLAVMILASSAAQQAWGTIAFSTGSGSAVTSVDRSANFDMLMDGDDLSNYSEGQLSITIHGTANLSQDPFGNVVGGFRDIGKGFYCAGVIYDSWVTIKSTDGRRILAIEFLYGKAWSTDTFGPEPSEGGNNSAFIEWQADSGSVMVTSGITVGTVIGFSDNNPTGFETFRIRAPLSLDFPDYINQAIALDNLRVQLAPIPEPSTWITGIALSLPFGVQVLRHLRNRKQVS